MVRAASMMSARSSASASPRVRTATQQRSSRASATLRTTYVERVVCCGITKQPWSTPEHLHQCRHTIKCLRDSRWPARTSHIVKDCTGIERSVERVFVTDVGEVPRMSALT